MELADLAALPLLVIPTFPPATQRQHKIHTFLAICAAWLLCGVASSRSSGDKLPFARPARTF